MSRARWLLVAALLACALRLPARADEDVAPSDAEPGETAVEPAAAETPAEADAAEAPSKDIELLGEGGEEEEPEEPAAAPTPAPKPRPKPKPKPKPAPKPAPPASPFAYLPIEDFEGAERGTVMRAGPDPKPQFTAAVGAAGFASAKALTLTAVPGMADGTAWVLTLPAPLDLSAWRGLSIRARSSAPTVELRLGVAGGGSVYGAAVLGTDWSEVRLEFARAAGRGRFDARAVRAIVVTAAHELLQPVDVQVDGISAWRERVPSEALRLGLNVPPLPGPLDWRAAVEAVNCAPRAAAGEGLVLGFWSAPLPYQHWPSAVEFRELPRGLDGATGLIAQLKVEPASPPVLLKLSLVEERGERFAALRAVPADGSALRLPFRDFAPDTLANLRLAPANADGKLQPGAVAGWSLEVLPTTERQFKGTVFLQDFWAESGDVPKAPPPPKAPRKPKVRAKPKPAPVAAPPPAEEPATEEAPAEEGTLEMEGEGEEVK